MVLSVSMEWKWWVKVAALGFHISGVRTSTLIRAHMHVHSTHVFRKRVRKWVWSVHLMFFGINTSWHTGVLDVHGKLLWYLIKSKRSPTNASNIYLSHKLPFTLVKGGKEMFINTLSSHKKRRTKGHIAEWDIVCDVGEVFWCHQAHF